MLMVMHLAYQTRPPAHPLCAGMGQAPTKGNRSGYCAQKRLNVCVAWHATSVIAMDQSKI